MALVRHGEEGGGEEAAAARGRGSSGGGRSEIQLFVTVKIPDVDSTAPYCSDATIRLAVRLFYFPKKVIAIHNKITSHFKFCPMTRLDSQI